MKKTIAPPASPAATRPVALWLFALCAMIFAMVVLGGVTRLTHSGLSMVEWRPILGWLPPLGEAEWQDAFAKYKQFPEFKKLNPDMDLTGFKSIFWLEYLHRLWGRLIGFAFLLPFLYFLARGRITRAMAPWLVGAFILGGLQGVLGWVMVQSGLVDRPDVSQYRLAAHLAAAFAIYGYLLWFALGLWGARREPTAMLKGGALAAVALVSVTVVSGAFVAGLDAGLVHNSFPLMGGGFVPDDLLTLKPLLLNFFENRAAVQFDHRVLAYATIAAVVLLWLAARRRGVPGPVRAGVSVLFLAVSLQAALGIVTLVLFVPVPVAAAHQAGALILFTAALWLLHRVGPRPI